MDTNKIILDLCGGTGSWSKYYSEAGYDVKIITLPEYDVQSYIPPNNVYGIIAAPPCTMFSFARTRGNKSKRDLKIGMELVIACLKIIWECQYKIINQYSQKSILKFWCLENPNGHLKYFLGKPVFEFDPYEFGDIYSKKTHLWGWFNNPIKTHGKETRTINNKFDKLSMKEINSISDNIYKNKITRQDLRSITPKGFAQAFFKANK